MPVLARTASRRDRLVGFCGRCSRWDCDGESKLTKQTNGNNTKVVYDYFEKRNWPTSIKQKFGGANFASFTLEYDGNQKTVGNLTRVTEIDGSVASFAYDSLYRLTSESRTGTNPGGNANFVAVYTWGAAGLVSQRRSGSSYWYHFGPQGETRRLTNSAGAVTDSYTFSAFGETLLANTTVVNPFRYGGQFGYYTDLNAPNGTILCGARWYWPKLGRWLSRDPIGFVLRGKRPEETTSPLPRLVNCGYNSPVPTDFKGNEEP